MLLYSSCLILVNYLVCSADGCLCLPCTAGKTPTSAPCLSLQCCGSAMVSCSHGLLTCCRVFGTSILPPQQSLIDMQANVIALHCQILKLGCEGYLIPGNVPDLHAVLQQGQRTNHTAGEHFMLMLCCSKDVHCARREYRYHEY